MSKPRYKWWGYVRNILRCYPDNVTEEEKLAVDAAIEKTIAMKNGETRMKVVELALIKHTNTIEGAAMKAYCSEGAARGYSKEFIREVARNFSCRKLL